MQVSTNVLLLTEEEYKACHTHKCFYEVGKNVGCYRYHDTNGNWVYHLNIPSNEYTRQWIYSDLKQAGLL